MNATHSVHATTVTPFAPANDLNWQKFTASSQKNEDRKTVFFENSHQEKEQKTCDCAKKAINIPERRNKNLQGMTADKEYQNGNDLVERWIATTQEFSKEYLPRINEKGVHLLEPQNDEIFSRRLGISLLTPEQDEVFIPSTKSRFGIALLTPEQDEVFIPPASRRFGPPS